MRLQPLLMQLLMGMSISRYLPAIGTAGLLRSMVKGNRREPRPPPRIRLSTSCCMCEHPTNSPQPDERQGSGLLLRLSHILLRAEIRSNRQTATWSYLLWRLGAIAGVAVQRSGHDPIRRPARQLHE